MADYVLQLTPAVRNMGTEGSMDTSILNGVSIQRDGQAITVVNGTTRKEVRVVDGGTFDDVMDTILTTPGFPVIAG